MRNKNSEIFKDILGVLGTVGLVSIALFAPNALQVFGSKYTRNASSRYAFKKSLKRLEKNGLVLIKHEGDKMVLSLTKDGKNKILKYKIEELRILKPKKWDHKWRIVIFDVPNQYSLARLAFTRKLKELGFKYLQKSVWITPYPCEDEVDFVAGVYEINKYVRIITAESIDIQKGLVKEFGL